MENARQRVNQTTVDIMRSSRVQGGAAGGMPGQYGMPQQVIIVWNYVCEWMGVFVVFILLLVLVCLFFSVVAVVTRYNILSLSELSCAFI